MKAAVFVDTQGNILYNTGGQNVDIIYHNPAIEEFLRIYNNDPHNMFVYGPMNHLNLMRGILPVGSRVNYIAQIDNGNYDQFHRTPGMREALKNIWIFMGERYYKGLARYIDQLHVFHTGLDRSASAVEKFPNIMDELNENALIKNYYY